MPGHVDPKAIATSKVTWKLQQQQQQEEEEEEEKELFSDSIAENVKWKERQHHNADTSLGILSIEESPIANSMLCLSPLVRFDDDVSEHSANECFEEVDDKSISLIVTSGRDPQYDEMLHQSGDDLLNDADSDYGNIILAPWEKESILNHEQHDTCDREWGTSIERTPRSHDSESREDMTGQLNYEVFESPSVAAKRLNDDAKEFERSNIFKISGNKRSGLRLSQQHDSFHSIDDSSVLLDRNCLSNAQSAVRRSSLKMSNSVRDHSNTSGPNVPSQVPVTTCSTSLTNVSSAYELPSPDTFFQSRSGDLGSLSGGGEISGDRSYAKFRRPNFRDIDSPSPNYRENENRKKSFLTVWRGVELAKAAVESSVSGSGASTAMTTNSNSADMLGNREVDGLSSSLHLAGLSTTMHMNSAMLSLGQSHNDNNMVGSVTVPLKSVFQRDSPSRNHSPASITAPVSKERLDHALNGIRAATVYNCDHDVIPTPSPFAPRFYPSHFNEDENVVDALGVDAGLMSSTDARWRSQPVNTALQSVRHIDYGHGQMIVSKDSLSFPRVNVHCRGEAFIVVSVPPSGESITCALAILQDQPPLLPGSTSAFRIVGDTILQVDSGNDGVIVPLIFAPTHTGEHSGVLALTSVLNSATAFTSSTPIRPIPLTRTVLLSGFAETHKVILLPCAGSTLKFGRHSGREDSAPSCKLVRVINRGPLAVPVKLSVVASILPDYVSAFRMLIARKSSDYDKEDVNSLPPPSETQLSEAKHCINATIMPRCGCIFVWILFHPMGAVASGSAVSGDFEARLVIDIESEASSVDVGRVLSVDGDAGSLPAMLELRGQAGEARIRVPKELADTTGPGMTFSTVAGSVDALVLPVRNAGTANAIVFARVASDGDDDECYFHIDPIRFMVPADGTGRTVITFVPPIDAIAGTQYSRKLLLFDEQDNIKSGAFKVALNGTIATKIDPPYCPQLLKQPQQQENQSTKKSSPWWRNATTVVSEDISQYIEVLPSSTLLWGSVALGRTKRETVRLRNVHASATLSIFLTVEISNRSEGDDNECEFVVGAREFCLPPNAEHAVSVAFAPSIVRVCQGVLRVFVKTENDIVFETSVSLKGFGGSSNVRPVNLSPHGEFHDGLLDFVMDVARGRLVPSTEGAGKSCPCPPGGSLHSIVLRNDGVRAAYVLAQPRTSGVVVTPAAVVVPVQATIELCLALSPDAPTFTAPGGTVLLQTGDEICRRRLRRTMRSSDKALDDSEVSSVSFLNFDRHFEGEVWAASELDEHDQSCPTDASMFLCNMRTISIFLCDNENVKRDEHVKKMTDIVKHDATTSCSPEKMEHDVYRASRSVEVSQVHGNDDVISDTHCVSADTKDSSTWGVSPNLIVFPVTYAQLGPASLGPDAAELSRHIIVTNFSQEKVLSFSIFTPSFTLDTEPRSASVPVVSSSVIKVSLSPRLLAGIPNNTDFKLHQDGDNEPVVIWEGQLVVLCAGTHQVVHVHIELRHAHEVIAATSTIPHQTFTRDSNFIGEVNSRREAFQEQSVSLKDQRKREDIHQGRMDSQRKQGTWRHLRTQQVQSVPQREAVKPLPSKTSHVFPSSDTLSSPHTRQPIGSREPPLSEEQRSLYSKNKLKDKLLERGLARRIEFKECDIGKRTFSSLAIHNVLSVPIRWNIQEIAPAFVQTHVPLLGKLNEQNEEDQLAGATSTGHTSNVFRVNYPVFAFVEMSGILNSLERIDVRTRFRPRDKGHFSQFFKLCIYSLLSSSGDNDVSVDGAIVSCEKVEMSGRTASLLTWSEAPYRDMAFGLPQPTTNSRVKKHRLSAAITNSLKSLRPDSESFLPRKSSSRRSSTELYTECNEVRFPPTVIGQSRIMEIKVCNGLGTRLSVLVKGLQAPFVVRHERIDIEGSCFVWLPISFWPVRAGIFRHSLVLRSLDGDQSCSVNLVGRAVCEPLLMQHAGTSITFTNRSIEHAVGLFNVDAVTLSFSARISPNDPRMVFLEGERCCRSLQDVVINSDESTEIRLRWEGGPVAKHHWNPLKLSLVVKYRVDTGDYYEIRVSLHVNFGE